MSGKGAHSVSTHVRESLHRPNSRALFPDSAPLGRDAMTDSDDKQEARQRQRARRQALLMLIGSSAISLAILYGLWTLFVRLV